MATTTALRIATAAVGTVKTFTTTAATTSARRATKKNVRIEACLNEDETMKNLEALSLKSPGMLALYDPRLRGALQAAEFILTFQRGPWTGQKWHRVLQEEAQEWAATSAGDPLVKHFLPRIAQETGIPIADLTPDRIRSLLQSAKFLQRRGPPTLSRWDAYTIIPIV